MNSYIISLLVGVLVGVIYASLRVKSPAPPLIALIGLLGMVIGEAALPVVKGALFHGKNEIGHVNGTKK